MVGAKNRSCSAGMGTPGCQELVPGLSTQQGSGALHELHTCPLAKTIDGGPEGATSLVALSLGHPNVQKWLSSCKKEDQRKNNTGNCHIQKVIQQ